MSKNHPYTVWTRHAIDGDKWVVYESCVDFASALMEFQWACIDPDLRASRYAHDDADGAWHVKILGPFGAVRHFYSSDGHHDDALHYLPILRGCLG